MLGTLEDLHSREQLLDERLESLFVGEQDLLLFEDAVESKLIFLNLPALLRDDAIEHFDDLERVVRIDVANYIRAY